MRTPKIPEGAEVVRTYAAYQTHVEAFFRGRYNLLLVVGSPGLSKSYSFEDRLGRTSHLIRGWTAPLQAYIESYRHRNKLLIFDDAEVLWKRPGGRVLLRSLCELKPEKLLQWTSTSRDLVNAEVPQSFLTTSRVAIVANRFVFGDAEEQEAILDRGHLIHFDPTPVEIHTKVADWFWCQEIYDYVGDRLHLLANVSARLYVKLWERRQAGGDWRSLLDDAYCRDSAKRYLQALEMDPACETVEDRVKKFVEFTGACRATYFNLKRELKKTDQLHAFERTETPKRQLHRQPPEEPNLEDEIAKARQEDERNNGHGGSGSRAGPQDHGDVPSWCEYSDDPNDYNSYSDYLDDWWKRPRLSEEAECSSPDPEIDDHVDVDDMTRLRRELGDAIRKEDYELAAKLRNEIQQRELRDEEDR